MLHLAVRVVCDQCNWKGWLRVGLAGGLLTQSNGTWRNGQNSIGYLGHVEIMEQSELQMLMIPVQHNNTAVCPQCHGSSVGIDEPGYYSYDMEWSPCRFDPAPDQLDGPPLAVPEPPPPPPPPPPPEPKSLEPEPEPLIHYFYDVWCPHCTHVDSIATLQPDLGMYEAKCPKCSKAHQVYLNGNGKRGVVA